MDSIFAPATEFQTSQWLFLRLMALSYFLAFWSLSVQVLGLYGSRGILPILDYSDKTLYWGTIAGMILSVLAFVGIYPAFLFVCLYIIYLQYHTKGEVFLSFQWDTLLLETGFMTILYAIQTPPPYAMVFLFWVFLFRFMFSAGIVKIISGCPAWKSFTAMDVHYETQPIPNLPAYYMHQLPSKFGQVSQWIMYFIEMVVPFFIFTPMPLRFVTFCFLIFLQIIILLTGNYAFFNGLTMILCIPLLSDDYLPTLPLGFAFPDTLWTAIPLTLFAAALIILNLIQFAGFYFDLRRVRMYIQNWLGPYRLINHYGLFAVMTTKRNEIIIEGSRDGQDWKVYEFKYKPGDPKIHPKQVAPHQPRLDWQMWFAALRNFRTEYWLQSFMVKLLEGSPDVIRLLKTNPFPDEPPAFVRAQLYNYHFTTLKEKKETGSWWKRSYLGLYSPTYRLTNKK